jgi:ribosomal protein S18 acetylase RimI-like enzyme
MSEVASRKRVTAGGTCVFVREQVKPQDPARVRRILESTGVFNVQEVEVAVELVQARLSQGTASGYHFLFVEPARSNDETLGYSCFGPIPCTLSSFDLYWIAVQNEYRGIGLGRLLLAEAEAAIGRMGGSRVYAETSSRPEYEPTRIFYSRRGYRLEALIRDFYAPGDGKMIYAKELP